MGDSPFQSPGLHGAEPLSGEDGKLLRIAKYQRWVIAALLLMCWVFLGTLLNNLFQEGVFLPPEDPLVDIFQGLVALLELTALVLHYIVAILGVYFLTKEFSSRLVTGFMVLSQLIPCVSLLVLLGLYVHTTLFLESKGVKVGFLGAGQKSVRRQLDQLAINSNHVLHGRDKN